MWLPNLVVATHSLEWHAHMIVEMAAGFLQTSPLRLMHALQSPEETKGVRLSLVESARHPDDYHVMPWTYSESLSINLLKTINEEEWGEYDSESTYKSRSPSFWQTSERIKSKAPAGTLAVANRHAVGEV